jgi:hypothetical protein
MDDQELVAHRAEVATATEAMRNNGDDDPIEGEQDLPKKLHPSARFWQYANGKGIERAVAGQFVQDANGDFDQALKALKASENQ